MRLLVSKKTYLVLGILTLLAAFASGSLAMAAENSKATLSTSPTGEKAIQIDNSVGVIPVYRLYNHGLSEHFFTIDVNERDRLVKSWGWKYEGIAWYAPEKSSTPVYRLYNPGLGDHHYTKDIEERERLTKYWGWKYESIGWYSDDNKGVAVHRLYNGRFFPGRHHYTVDAAERDDISAHHGWNREGIGWYGIPSTYTLSFDCNGGTGSMDTKTINCGTSYTLPANTMTNSPYRFVCWNTKPDGTGISYSDKARVLNLADRNKHATLYAIWSNTYTETFVLISDTHLDTSSSALNVSINAAFNRVMNWAAEQRPQAFIHAGDVTDRGTTAGYNQFAKTYENKLGSTPRICAMGNHDTGANGIYRINASLGSAITQSRILRDRFIQFNGSLTPYKKMVHANIMVIGGIRGDGFSVLTDSMLTTLDKRLKETTITEDKLAIVVCHYPVDHFSLGSQATRLQNILGSYPNVVYVSGHVHNYNGNLFRWTKRAGKYSVLEIGLESSRYEQPRDYASEGDGYKVSKMIIKPDGTIVVERYSLKNGTKRTHSWTFTRS